MRVLDLVWLGIAVEHDTGCLVISEGTIYPILSRLKREGLLKTKLQESPEGPARKYYQLTSRGQGMLSDMSELWDQVIAGIDEIGSKKGTK